VRADAPDIAAMVRHRCGVAHCPASNAKLAHGIAPLVEMLGAGLDVGLGSDSMASNNRMDMVGEGRLAALQQRSRTGRADVIPAAQVLELATHGGARALGLGASVGLLAEGYQADLAAFALHDASAPVHDIATSIVHAGGNPAVRTVVAGRERVRDGVVLHEDALLARRVQAHADELARWRGADPGL
jgi:5-methylthioadenosine/S-adenosylhomocysteine deaminase